MQKGSQKQKLQLYRRTGLVPTENCRISLVTSHVVFEILFVMYSSPSLIMEAAYFTCECSL